MTQNANTFLQVRDLVVEYTSDGKVIHAVNGVNFDLERGKALALVGETGAGKTTIAKSIMRILPDPPAHVRSGQVVLQGRDLMKLNEADMRKVRGKEISMIFQDPMTALNPTMRIGDQIAEVIRLHDKVTKAESMQKAQKMLETVGITAERYGNYPHQFSGGQRQRVALGRAIVREPAAFLLDEPLSNLDAKLRVSMRTEISKLHREMGATTIYVTHDQVEAMTMADRIVIMKEGVIQQVGKPMELYDHPVNKFVAGFIGSPQMNFYDVKVDGKKLIFADGNIVELPEAIAKRIAGYSEVIMGIRGEDIKFDTTNLDVYGSHQKAVIDNTEIMGNENNLYFDFGGSVTIARVSKYEVSQVGDEVEFTFMPHKMHFFDKETEQVIGAE